MKALLTALGCILLSGCIATGQQRGVTNGSYISTSRPAICLSVKDIPLKTSGFITGSLRNPGVVSGLNVDIRTAVYATDARHPMAILMHASLPNDNWIWTTVLKRPIATHDWNEFIDGHTFAAYTYLVPINGDPFAGIAGDPAEAAKGERQTYWLARYFAEVTNFRRDKIILEYREPAPAELTTINPIPYGFETAVKEFEARALKAFTVGLPPENVGQIARTYPEGIQKRFLSDEVLGDVLQQSLPMAFR